MSFRDIAAFVLQMFIYQFVVCNKINNFKTFRTKITALIWIYARGCADKYYKAYMHE